MRIRFGWILFLASLLVSPLVAAGDLLARIGAQINEYPVLQAEFVQTKQMAALKRPLVTTGRLTFSRQYGVLWQIEKPYRVSYVLGEERIVEIGSDGVRRERGLRDVAGLAQVGRVFRALLGADTRALQEHFEVLAQGEVDHWSLVLTPRQAQLAQFLAKIQLTGSRFVESITISEAGGDSTQIKFRNTLGGTSLSDTDLQIYGGPGK